MNKRMNIQEFEKDLLSYTEMCYSVAFALTHDRSDAEDLARHVLMQAWLTHNHSCDRRVTKEYLLTGLRKRYLQCYRKTAEEVSTDAFPPLRLANEAKYGETCSLKADPAVSRRTSCGIIRR